MNSLSLLVVGLLMGVFIGLHSAIIGTYTTYIASMLGKKHSSNSVAGAGLLTLFYFAMLVIIVSFVIAAFIESLSLDYQQALLVSVPVVTIILGITYIRRYFWHEPLVKIAHTKQVAIWFGTKTTNFLQPLLVAATLLYIILPLYMVTAISLNLITLLIGEVPLFWVVPFAVGVIAPLYGILALVSTKTSVAKVLLWKEKTKATMYLYCGFALLLLAWLVLYVTIQTGSK